jgi:glucose dehydrogenase
MMSPAADTPLKTDTCSIGVKIPSLLAHNDASLATVSTKTGVLVYYYASRDVPSIRELTISGIPGSSQHPEAFTAAANAPIVAQPALATNTSQLSLYQPIGAVTSTLGSGSSQTIQVFWAEGVVDAGSGYSTLKSLQRNVSDAWEPSSYGAGRGQVSIPLGNSNAP